MRTGTPAIHARGDTSRLLSYVKVSITSEFVLAHRIPQSKKPAEKPVDPANHAAAGPPKI